MYLTSVINASPERAPQTCSAEDAVRPCAASFGSGLRTARSVVDDFKNRNPDRARHVEQQVRAGLNYIEKNGLSADMTAAMTMDEYQAYIYALTAAIPYDRSRPNDTTVISISDKGWEQMRRDPEYEAWIIGYLVEDRSIRNPFYSWGDNGGSVISEHFGASIEEHHGMGFSKPTAPDNEKDGADKEEDWWIRRHRRIKKLIREQAEKSMQQNIAQRTRFQREYALRQYEEAQSGIQTSRRPASKPCPDTGAAVTVPPGGETMAETSTATE